MSALGTLDSLSQRICSQGCSGPAQPSFVVEALGMKLRPGQASQKLLLTCVPNPLDPEAAPRGYI